MQTRSSIDPLDSTVAVGVDAPGVQTLASEPPPRVSQTAAMRVVDAFAEALVVAALLGELGLVLANVFARAYFHHSFLWADEVARLSLSILAFVGGAVAYRRRDHAFVRIVLNLVPRPIERVIRTAAEMAAVLKANPFPKAAPKHTVAIFLDAPPPADALGRASGVKDEKMRLGTREIFVHYGAGMGKSKLNIPAAKAGTARNMNTIAKLVQMAANL
jgi:hypothetical protein